MIEVEKYWKKWGSVCRIFEGKEKPIHHHRTLLQFAEDYHQEQLRLLRVSRSKPKDTNYRSGIVNLEFIKRDSEGVHYKATPIEEEFTQTIEDKTLS